MIAQTGFPDKNQARVFLAALAAALLVPSQSPAFTSGPAMPEYSDFESVEHNDLVNLTTGSFTYSIPVVTVPGPGTAFPVVLSYHSNILAKQEASWVGLGWNIQAGAINRNINRVPDDFMGDLIKEEMKSQAYHSFFVSVSVDQVMVGYGKDSERGRGGIIGYSPKPEGGQSAFGGYVGFGSMAGVGVTYASAVQSGQAFNQFTLGISAESGLDYGVESQSTVGKAVVGIGISSSQGMSVSLAYGKMGISLSNGGVGINNNHPTQTLGISMRPLFQDDSWAFGGVFPVYGHIVGFNISNTEYKIDGLEEDRYYGFLHTEDMGCVANVLCSNTSESYPGSTNGNRVRKMEVNSGSLPYESKEGSYAYLGGLANDAYSVAAQGISGDFQPYRTEDGDYFTYLSKKNFEFYNAKDWKTIIPFCQGCNKDEVTFDFAKVLESGNNSANASSPDWRNLHTRGDAIVWKYLGEAGGALYSNPNGDRDARHVIGHTPRKIEPLFKSGKIAGWIVTKEDGIRYLFTEKQDNFAQTITASDDATGENWMRQDMPAFSYAWLLTAMLSPDYVMVDNGNRECEAYDDMDGTPSRILCKPMEGDIGGWVRMNYTAKERYYWRAPYTGRQRVETGDKQRESDEPKGTRFMLAEGVKSVGYLQSIETATHKAEFHTEARMDGRGSSEKDFIYSTRASLSGLAPAQMRRLRRIDLRSKVFDKVVSSTAFEYDYSLAKNTPNSEAPGKGRLTLRSVRQGAGPDGPWLPAFHFSYGANADSPPEPNGKVDYWGYFCNSCHSTKYEPDGTPAPWNLSVVKDPSGGEMAVEYEQNRIASIGDKPVVRPPNYDYSRDFAIKTADFGSDPQDFSYMKMRSTTQTELQKHHTVLLGASLDEKHHIYQITEAFHGAAPEKYLVEFHSGSSAAFIMDDWNSFIGDYNSNDDYCFYDWAMETVMNRTAAEAVPGASETQGYQVWNRSDRPTGMWVGNYSFEDGELFTPACRWGKVFRVPKLSYARVWGLYSAAPQTEAAGFFIGGGSRVARISMKDGFSGKKNSIRYEYLRGNTPTLPRSYANYSTEFYHTSQTGDALFAGNPGIMYGEVRVHQEQMSYRTDYHFITSRDLPVVLTVTEGKRKDGSVIPRVDSKVEVLDRTQLWGQLWKKVDRNASNSPVRTIKTRWAQNWRIGDELLRGAPEPVSLTDESATFNPIKDGMVVRPSFSTQASDQQKYFGVSQEFYSVRNFGLNQEGQACQTGQMWNLETCLNQRGVHTTQIGRYSVLPYQAEGIEVIDGLKSVKKYSNHDYLTGNPLLVSENVKPGVFDAMLTSPAYLHRQGQNVYQRMLDKNMLTQQFSSVKFRFTSDPSDRDFSDPEGDLGSVVGASATLWSAASDPGGNQIRESGSYVLRDQTDFIMPNPGTNFDGVKWMSQGVNTVYDKFGNLLEGRTATGTYNARIFAYGNSLPVATATNAKANNVFYQSFETGEFASDLYFAAPHHATTKRYRTGAKSLQVLNCKEEIGGTRVSKPGCGQNDVSTMVCFDAPELDAGQTYIASAWYFDEFQGSNPGDPDDIAFKNLKSGVTRPGLFIGKPDVAGCAAEVHPNGAQANTDPNSWIRPAGSGDWHAAQRSTGGKGWKRIWTEFRPADNCADNGKIKNAITCLYASKGYPGSDVYYDEVRIRPKDAFMSTYTYDHKGQIASVAGADEVVKHFQYDKLGNLAGVRDEDGVLLSEQAKRHAKPDAEWSIRFLNHFNEGCQEFELMPSIEGLRKDFEFLGTSPSTNATVSRRPGVNGSLANFLCNKPTIQYSMKLEVKETGKVHVIPILASPLPTLVINGCSRVGGQWTQVENIPRYDGRCYDLDHNQSYHVPLSTHFGFRLPSWEDFVAAGLSEHEVLTGYRIHFDFPAITQSNLYAGSEGEWPLHLKFNYFNDLGSNPTKIDDGEYQDLGGTPLPGREFKLVTGSYSSLGNICEAYMRTSVEKVYTQNELGLLAMNISSTELSRMKDLFIFSVQGRIAPATSQSFWPYILGGMHQSHGTSNVKISITPLTVLSPNPPAGNISCTQ